MNANQDPLDQAFGLLTARSQGRAPTNPDLEELVMRDFGNATRPKMTRLTRVAAAVVLCLFVTGAAAATGGIDWFLNWTGTLEQDDGSVVNIENGEVTSGTVNRDGTMLEFENGKITDEDGSEIGTVRVELTPFKR